MPTIAENSASASSGVSSSMSTRCAPGMPASRERLVTMTAFPDTPGINGFNCWASRALSSRISIRLSANSERYSAERWSSESGALGEPSACRKSPSTTAGSAGDAPAPRRSTYS